MGIMAGEKFRAFINHQKQKEIDEGAIDQACIHSDSKVADSSGNRQRYRVSVPGSQA